MRPNTAVRSHKGKMIQRSSSLSVETYSMCDAFGGFWQTLMTLPNSGACLCRMSHVVRDSHAERDLARLNMLIREASRCRQHLSAGGANSTQCVGVKSDQQLADLLWFAAIELVDRPIEQEF